MEDRFKVVSTSPIFENLVSVLDVSMWPLEDNILSSYCNNEILALTNHYEQLLTQNGTTFFKFLWNGTDSNLTSYQFLSHNQRSTTLKSRREFSKTKVLLENAKMYCT